MLPVKGTVLLEFKLFLGIPPVFAGGIVSPFTLGTLEGYQFCYLFLACHILLLNLTKYHGKNQALDQNRTDDLILTMDMLCQLSYKGTYGDFITFWKDSNIIRFSQQGKAQNL